IVIDSIYSNESGYFAFKPMPYGNYALKPEAENSEEMFIKTKDLYLIKDNFNNLYLQSSSGMVMDFISPVQFNPVTYILEPINKVKSRCVVFENGDKAKFITFYIKDSTGNKVDEITTDKDGCFVLRK